VEELIKRIVEKSGLEESEVRERVEAKRRELNGLITPEGAAHIVAGELGINFLEGVVEVPRLKLENIIPGMSSVDVIGRLTKLFEVRSFEREDGSKGKVASGILCDDTSAVRIAFWDDKAELVERGEVREGDIIKLREGYTRESLNGEPEIHVGARGLVEVNPEDVDVDDLPLRRPEPSKLSELTSDMRSVDVAVRVLRIFEPRSFEREDGSKGRVASLIVADETKAVRAVLWDEDSGLVEKGEIKEGDVLLLKRAYVRERLGEMEVHVGRYGKVVLNPPGVELGEVAAPELSGARRMSIEELEPGMKAEVRCTVVRLFENPTIYERDGERRLAVTAIVDDGTGWMRAVFFNKMGELLLNTTVEALEKGDGWRMVKDREREIAGKEILLTGSVKPRRQSERLELIVYDMELAPDPRREAELLLEQAQELIGAR